MVGAREPHSPRVRYYRRKGGIDRMPPRRFKLWAASIQPRRAKHGAKEVHLCEHLT